MAIGASQIARWLRKAREAAGLSQSEAARRSGVTADAISKWERGEKGIMAENFVSLAVVYGVTFEDMPNANIDAIGMSTGNVLYQFPSGTLGRRVAEPGPIVPAAPSDKLKRAAAPKKKSRRRRASGE